MRWNATREPVSRFCLYRVAVFGAPSSRLSDSRSRWDIACEPDPTDAGARDPDPLGSVTHDDLVFGVAPATVPGLQIDAPSKLFGGLDSPGVGSRIRIANREAFLVPRGLGKHAAQFDFARVCRLAVGLAFASLRFFLYYRHAGPVHLHIQDRNRLADDDRQI